MSVIHDALEKGGELSLETLELKVGRETSFPPDKNIEAFLKKGKERRRRWTAGKKLKKPALWAGSVLCVLTAFFWAMSVVVPSRFTPADGPQLDGVVVSSGQSQFALTGIIAGDRLQAIVNDRLVGSGDRIGDAVVKSVEDGRVVLERRGREIILSLS